MDIKRGGDETLLFIPLQFIYGFLILSVTFTYEHSGARLLAAHRLLTGAPCSSECGTLLHLTAVRPPPTSFTSSSQFCRKVKEVNKIQQVKFEFYSLVLTFSCPGWFGRVQRREGDTGGSSQSETRWDGTEPSWSVLWLMKEYSKKNPNNGGICIIYTNYTNNTE